MVLWYSHSWRCSPPRPISVFQCFFSFIMCFTFFSLLFSLLWCYDIYQENSGAQHSFFSFSSREINSQKTNQCEQKSALNHAFTARHPVLEAVFFSRWKNKCSLSFHMFSLWGGTLGKKTKKRADTWKKNKKKVATCTKGPMVLLLCYRDWICLIWRGRAPKLPRISQIEFGRLVFRMVSSFGINGPPWVIPFIVLTIV